MKQNNMLAMILAGGRGTRLHELTKKVAKPAVSYGGKYRIIVQTVVLMLSGFLHNTNPSSLTAMLPQDAAGVLTQKTVECMYFRPARRQTPILTFTGELLMRFHRTLILSIHILRNISLFFPETTSIK